MSPRASSQVYRPGAVRDRLSGPGVSGIEVIHEAARLGKQLSLGQLVEPFLLSGRVTCADEGDAPEIKMIDVQRIRIPGYRIARKLGAGATATVYLGSEERSGAAVALKVLHPWRARRVEIQRFHREARVMASLRHPGVIKVHGSGSADSIHYIAMTFAERGDLKRRIAQGMDSESALQVVQTVAFALRYLHGTGIVHRDVTPANILFSADGEAMLGDFGIALSPFSSEEVTGSAVEPLTGDTVTEGEIVLGTPAYLAPEQVMEGRVDARTDLYSLGIVFYEMLTGVRPYAGENSLATIHKHLREPLPALPQRLRRYEPLLQRMVAKRPEARFSDAGALLACIRSLRTERFALPRAA